MFGIKIGFIVVGRATVDYTQRNSTILTINEENAQPHNGFIFPFGIQWNSWRRRMEFMEMDGFTTHCLMPLPSLKLEATIVP